MFSYLLIAFYINRLDTCTGYLSHMFTVSFKEHFENYVAQKDREGFGRKPHKEKLVALAASCTEHLHLCLQVHVNVSFPCTHL